MLYRIRQFLNFYAAATTKYRVHSPFVFEWVNEVLENDRWYYAFSDVEKVRNKMKAGDAVIEMTDYGAGPNGQASGGAEAQKRSVSVRALATGPASTARQGRKWFHLTRLLAPTRILELGASAGIGTMYIASASRNSQMLALEGCPNTAQIARLNLDILNLRHVEVVVGPFESTLAGALERLQQTDLVFFDGNHRREATLRYFDACLPYIHARSAFVFDDIYWSEEMTTAWREIQARPEVRLTIDCFDFGVAFFNPDFHQKQHFRLVPAWWKPWKI